MTCRPILPNTLIPTLTAMSASYVFSATCRRSQPLRGQRQHERNISRGTGWLDSSAELSAACRHAAQSNIVPFFTNPGGCRDSAILQGFPLRIGLKLAQLVAQRAGTLVVQVHQHLG